MDCPPALVFGPVPSRRFGRSLGINHIPPKTCTYGCVYCQVGRTTERTITPRTFFAPDEVIAAVTQRVHELGRAGEGVDALTFVPDGEPTLDENLGQAIAGLKPLGLPVVVITNASLLWREGVAQAVATADRVCLKVDSVLETTWRRVDRPHPELDLDRLLDGVHEFAAAYEGVLTTETMLVQGVNDDVEGVEETALFLARLAPTPAWLAVPTRPPALGWVEPPDPARILEAWQAFARHLERVEWLLGDEGDAFSSTGDLEQDLLAITAVHPLTEDAVEALRLRCGAPPQALDRLVASGVVLRLEHGGRTFYARRLPSR